MTMHQRFQGETIMTAQEALQQLAVALLLAFVPPRRLPEALQKIADGIGRHAAYSGGGPTHPLPLLLPAPPALLSMILVTGDGRRVRLLGSLQGNCEHEDRETTEDATNK